MKRAALLLLGLPIACAPDAPNASEAGNMAVTGVEDVTAAPVVPPREPAPFGHDVPSQPPSVSRETSSPPSGVESDGMEGYRAIGTEPFWAVTVRGDHLILQRPDRPPLRFTVKQVAEPPAIRYAGEGMTMRVSPGPCSDGMSDAIWSDRVQIAFAEGTLDGCGGSRDSVE